MATFTDNAVKAESELNEKGLGFSLDSARLYSVNTSLNGDISLTLACQHPDIYDLLIAKEASAVAKVSDFIGVVTTGWAAPLNAEGEADGAPSEHPSRRRVRLFILANAEKVTSVVRFQDEDEVVIDEGTATGSLADAIQRLVATAK